MVAPPWGAGGAGQGEASMRIGLLTYFWEDNPGQYFQCLASVNALRQIFPEAGIEIPDVRHWTQPARATSRRDMLLRPWRNAARRRRRRKYDKARERFPVAGPTLVSTDPAETIREIESRKYDLLVVGSDAVLFLVGARRVRDNLPPLYWLVDLPNVPRAMLGPSAHTLRYEKLNAAQREAMSRGVKGFSFLAVRDPLTRNLLETLGPPEGVPVRVVPDPTLSYTIDPSPAQAYWADKRIPRDKPICGIDLPWESSFKQRLVQLLRRDFHLVELGGHYRECHPLLDLGPFEWSGIFSHFDLHVTTGFHDSIFCLKQGTPVFAVEGSLARYDPKSGNSKIRFLYEDFGILEGHYCNPDRDALTPEEFCRRIAEGWQRFDRQAARDHASELGRRYLNTGMEMRRTIGASLGLGD